MKRKVPPAAAAAGANLGVDEAILTQEALFGALGHDNLTPRDAPEVQQPVVTFPPARDTSRLRSWVLQGLDREKRLTRITHTCRGCSERTSEEAQQQLCKMPSAASLRRLLRREACASTASTCSPAPRAPASSPGLPFGRHGSQRGNVQRCDASLMHLLPQVCRRPGDRGDLRLRTRRRRWQEERYDVVTCQLFFSFARNSGRPSEPSWRLVEIARVETARC